MRDLKIKSRKLAQSCFRSFRFSCGVVAAKYIEKCLRWTHLMYFHPVDSTYIRLMTIGGLKCRYRQ